MRSNRCARVVLALTGCDGVFANPHMVPDAPSPDAPPDASPDAPPIDGKIVFTTSKQYAGGSLGGLEGADAICANLASQAGLTGEFKAWLSQIGTSATDRLTHSTKPYILVNLTTKVADSWDDLLNVGALHAIDLDEHGVALVAADGDYSARVWTATQINGREIPWTPGGDPMNNPRPDCTLWSTFDVAVGSVGYWSSTGAAWTEASQGFGCAVTARLYCFQQ